MSLTNRLGRLALSMVEVQGKVVNINPKYYVCVIYQKCDLTLFTFRGHNGVRSCVDCLHTDVSKSLL